jgi:hypothetical protein
MPPGSETIIQQWGAFGAVFVMILVPLGTYAWRQTQKLNEVQAARVQDAKDVRDVLLTATRDFSAALQEQVRLATETEGASSNIIDALSRIEGRLHEIENVMRDVRGPRR